jgi:hypothetical protein
MMSLHLHVLVRHANDLLALSTRGVRGAGCVRKQRGR